MAVFRDPPKRMPKPDFSAAASSGIDDLHAESRISRRAKAYALRRGGRASGKGANLKKSESVSLTGSLTHVSLTW